MFRDWEIQEGWTTVALMLIMLLCVAWSIQSAQWTAGLAILQAVVLVGGVLGIVLAKSRILNRMAHLLSVMAGFTWAAYLTSRVLSSGTGLSIEAAVVEFARRLQDWLYIVFTGGRSSGNYVFLFLLGLLLWIMAYFCAWAIFRWQRVWWAVILCGVAVIVNITYAPTNLTGFLVAFILFALLLVVRTSLASYEQEWRAARVGYSPELVYGFLRAGLAVTILAIILAWFAPDVLASRPMQDVWDKVSEPWRRLQEESSRVFQNLNYRNQPAFITFSRSMKFGGAVELTDAPVMEVEASTGRYWRVMVFHEYTSDGWTNTDTDTILIGENKQGFSVPDYDLRREVTQTITLRQNLGPQRTIAAAGQPLRADISLRALVTLITRDESEGADIASHLLAAAPGDPSVLYSQEPLRAGDSYQVVSSFTRADQESLREAGTDYPPWIVPRYLQLPETLPQRVVLLADQITAGRETPFEMAMAIERYLRDIPYNQRINAPAPGQDGVDYFLFDAREGYCDYYSSAMVVMLRAVGVPARYVRGYGRGLRDEGVYYVQEKNGHAWPEVFFPGYGWIEFEPTAAEPVLVRPRSQNTGNTDPADERERFWAERFRDQEFDSDFYPELLGPLPTATPEPMWQRIGRWGGLALSAVAFVLVFIALLMARRRRRIEGLSVTERVYLDLVEWVRRFLRLAPLAHQTPHEYAGSVTSMVPQGRSAVEQITDLYVMERFGGKPVPGEQAETAWRETWPLLLRRWLRRQGERIRNLPYRFVPGLRPKPRWHEVDADQQE